MNIIELVWTNPSPSSSFGFETISINLSAYRFLYGCFVYKTGGNSDYATQIIRVGDPNHKVLSSYAGTVYQRYWSATSSSLYFGMGSRITPYGTEDNNATYMVPLYVYGIK